MKKVRYIRLLSLLLALLLCFASCTADGGGAETSDVPGTAGEQPGADVPLIPTVSPPDLTGFADTISEEDKIAPEHSYAFLPFETRGDDWHYETGRIGLYDGMLCIHMSEQESGLRVLQRQAVFFDADGSIVKTVPYRQPVLQHVDREDVLERIGDVEMIDENTFLGSSNTIIIHNEPGVQNELDTGYLMLFDAEGNVLAEAPIPGRGGNGVLRRLPDGRIAVIGEESICIFDEHLQLMAQIGDGTETALFLSPRGELFAEGHFMGTYFRVDTEAYTREAETYYDNPKNVKGNTRMFFSAEESAYEVYFTNETGFWGYDVGDEEADLLCDWNNSGQVYDNLTVYQVMDADRLFVSVRDPFTNTEAFGYLYRDPDAQTARKSPIRIGIADNLLRFGLGIQETILENAVRQFNAENTQYFVEIVDYSDAGGERGDVPEAFTEAMLAGTAADIIVTSRYQHDAMRIYTAKNAFVDLQDAFGQSILPCALSAYTGEDGALYSVPINMKLSMQVCLADILPADQPLTLDALYSLADQAEAAGTALFNTPFRVSDNGGTLRELMLAAAVPSFADAESGECFYDSAEFGRFLSFIETLGDRAAGEEMRLSNDYGDYTVMSAEALGDALQKVDIAFLEFPFHTIDAYAILKMLYGDSAFAMHGYPTRDGEFIRITSEIDLHINASSKVKLGAAQFLAYLLSDPIQMYSADTVLPVTVSAVEALLADPTFVYAPGDLIRLDRLYSEEILSAVYPTARRITYDADDLAAIRRLLYETETSAAMDATMRAILEEELSAYRAGVRTLEETQAIIQSRLWIYINE